MAPGGLAAEAGFLPGDVLLSWHRAEAGGELVSPVDLDRVALEQAPRGRVTLAGRRGGAAVALGLGEGSWGLEARPLPGRRSGRALAGRRDPPPVPAWRLVAAAEVAGPDGVGPWAEAVAAAGDDPSTRAWVLDRCGRPCALAAARAVGPEAAVVHFATHGLVDELRPLSSALALTLPEQPAEGQENGLLQAWEVFEQVRLDADLVVLSACETALGKEQAGEGLLGLTRAFQYAGARAVLASLWSVADASTAELMRRFYGHLAAGMATDEALRQAQLALIRGEAGSGSDAGRAPFSHPFHWAAFELVGDWR